MEDGDSPLIGLFVFLLLLIMDMVMHGFLAAIDNLNDSHLEKEVQEGNKKALWLAKVKEGSVRIFPGLLSMMTLISVAAGIYQSRMYGKMLAKAVLSEAHPLWMYGICYGLTAIVTVFLLVSLGILAPEKIAARKAKKWAFFLAGIMRPLMAIVSPFAFLVDKLSDLIVKICGMDPGENMDDVTEEELISMVNEVHEQGALMASEAEMIHNIFEFRDKEAKDIMTRRKHIVAVDGAMSLQNALEFMLEKNNSRFPVFIEDIDNITGIVHIKDAMLRSREQDMLEQEIVKIPGLVREARFIPETRNINSLFQAMQSLKNHMVIVVDEYGQTAGLVAMEDILEEIVGNILDEYDEEDTMIIQQGDGTFLMKGMAPLDEVCTLLGLDYGELEDYDTLNGYLISLIDKIPVDHEVFEIQDRGYLFQVLFVENKMIQNVKVIPVREGEEEGAKGQETDSPCQDVQSMVE